MSDNFIDGTDRPPPPLPPPPEAERLRAEAKNRKLAAIVLVGAFLAVMAYGLVQQIQDASTDDEAGPTSTETTTTVPAPAYEIRLDRDGVRNIEVESADWATLERVLAEVVADNPDGDDGWVRLCVDDQWVALGRWAHTPLGAARNGLEVGEVSLEPESGNCPD